MNTMQRQKKMFELLEQMLGGLLVVIIALVPVAVIWTLNTQPALPLVLS